MVTAFRGESIPLDRWVFVKKFAAKLFITFKINAQFLLHQRALLNEKKKVYKKPCRRRTVVTQKIVKVYTKIRVCRTTQQLENLFYLPTPEILAISFEFIILRPFVMEFGRYLMPLRTFFHAYVTKCSSQ